VAQPPAVVALPATPSLTLAARAPAGRPVAAARAARRARMLAVVVEGPVPLSGPVRAPGRAQAPATRVEAHGSQGVS